MKGKKRMILKIIGIIAVCVVLAIIAVTLFIRHQINKIPALSFDEALAYTTQNNGNAVITVGIIKNGEASFTVYGNNASKLPQKLHNYEIGSITKTVTATLISKAIQDEKINLNYTIDKYLELPEGKNYPTISQLLTHTSGYKSYYFQQPMISNFFKGKNDFYNISREMILDKVADINLNDKTYSFKYSNFGYAVLGLVLESVYKQDYTDLVNDYIYNELGLHSSQISNRSGDLHNYWDWSENDGYIPAGAITSNIEDMLSYAKLQMDGFEYIEKTHTTLSKINATTDTYSKMDIRMDEIGMAWLIDTKNDFIWHNGGTGNYNSYIAFCPKTQTAVVVLSNLSPNYRIPATVLGIKLLQSLQ